MRGLTDTRTLRILTTALRTRQHPRLSVVFRFFETDLCSSHLSFDSHRQSSRCGLRLKKDGFGFLVARMHNPGSILCLEEWAEVSGHPSVPHTREWPHGPRLRLGRMPRRADRGFFSVARMHVHIARGSCRAAPAGKTRSRLAGEQFRASAHAHVPMLALTRKRAGRCRRQRPAWITLIRLRCEPAPAGYGRTTGISS